MIRLLVPRVVVGARVSKFWISLKERSQRFDHWCETNQGWFAFVFTIVASLIIAAIIVMGLGEGEWRPGIQ